jgi:hypothetical protein
MTSREKRQRCENANRKPRLSDFLVFERKDSNRGRQASGPKGVPGHVVAFS